MVHDLRTDCSSFRSVPGWINVGCLKDGACFFCVLVILVITHAICMVQLLLSDLLMFFLLAIVVLCHLVVCAQFLVCHSVVWVLVMLYESPRR